VNSYISSSPKPVKLERRPINLDPIAQEMATIYSGDNNIKKACSEYSDNNREKTETSGETTAKLATSFYLRLYERRDVVV